MRTYPQDSPQAAARIVAIAALADGHMCSTEARLMESVAFAKALGLQAGEWHAVLRSYCEDVLAYEPMGWSAAIADSPMIASLLAEVRDPILRRTVVDLCAAVANADSHLAPGESIILKAAAEQWGLVTPESRCRPAPARGEG
jgi:uncharacterized tellurite resistance protein B-like protein